MNRVDAAIFASLLLACGSDPMPAADGDGGDSGGPTSTAGATTTTGGGPGGTDGATTGDTGDGETGMVDPGPSDLDLLRQLVLDLQAAPDDAARWALTDTFFDVVHYGDDGFPIRDDGELGFALIHEGPTPLTVAGDFNAWAEGSEPLEPAVDGFPFWYRITADPGGTDRSLYKFVAAGTFFADPQARRFGWDEFGEYSLVAAGGGQSHYERWLGFSEQVGALEPRRVVVYVPPGPAPAEGLPVLYMHDGQNVFDPDAFFGGWRVGEAMDDGLAVGTLAPALVVAIDNTPARMDEYTHTTDDLGGGPIGGRADEYADYVVDGLKPFVDARYDTDPDPDTTGILGSSMGGLVSLYIGQRHPDIFGHIGSMSGTLWWGEGAGNPRVLELYAADPPTGANMYIDSGGTNGCPGGGTDNYCVNVEMADLLRSLGWTDDQDLIYRWEPGAPHNEAAWAARVPQALSGWFPGS